jgi:hypothetical protein
MKLTHLAFVAASLFAANAMACYTVYDRSNRVAYQGEQPPVDMSLPLHTALQSRYPGGHMVFEQSASCQPVSLGLIARSTGPAAPPNTAIMGAGANRMVAVATPAMVFEPAAASASASNTAVMGAGPAGPVARRMNVVPPKAASRGASPLLTDRRTADSLHMPYTVLSGDIVVVPADAAARVDITGFNVVPSQNFSAAGARSETVITELHTPPLTVVQNGADTFISRR